MTRTTVVKLTVFIFLAFIVCLPEFFPSDTEIQIRFSCLPFDPCDTTSGRGPNDDGQDCEQTTLEFGEKGGVRRLCKEVLKNTTNQDEPVKDWFVCETQTDLQSLHGNASLSGVDVEIVLSLRVMNLSLQNVTLHSHVSWNVTLHSHVSWNVTLQSHVSWNVTTHGHENWNRLLAGSFQNVSQVHCCDRPSDEARKLPTGPRRPNTSRPVVPSERLSSSTESSTTPLPEQHDSASSLSRRLNRSQCFLHYPATAVPTTPARKGRRWCNTATVWLFLVLIVVIVVLMSVVVQVYTHRSSCHKQALGLPVPSTASNPKRSSKQKNKSLGDLPDGFHTEDEVLFVEKPGADHSRGLYPINETSSNETSSNEMSGNEMSDEDEGDDIFDDTVADEGSKESLDIGQIPAHAEFDFLTHLHHRVHSFSYDKDGGM
ncbi:uncharacterized protein LOC143523032 isoform X2 [Brachyhypopomus gauderio]|uniref:uncharacterized protein LOC143523032 isoform X2 n=1 Tax=Brachyhypopomus gauderio TaxID=698409 RepID=UPI0040425A75